MAHFHFKMRRVCAEPGRNVVRDKSAYIRRDRERDIRVRTPVRDVSSYMRRMDEFRDAQGEVLNSEFFLPPGVTLSRDAVWDGVDEASRRKDGEYKRHAGRMPCLSIFADASLPWGLSAEAAITATHAMAQWLVGTYGCAVECAIHIKDGQIDHAHFLYTDRVVTAAGIGPKIRSMNGIADRSTEVEGGRRVASFAEAARAEWARLIRLASGNDEIDHRSFERQGRDWKPCPDIPRAQYEYEFRNGLTASLDMRKAILVARIEREGAKRAHNSAAFAPSVEINDAPIRAKGDVSPIAERSSATAVVSERLPPKPLPIPDYINLGEMYDLVASAAVDTTRLDQLLRQLRECLDPSRQRDLIEAIQHEESRVRTRRISLELERKLQADIQRNLRAMTRQVQPEDFMSDGGYGKSRTVRTVGDRAGDSVQSRPQSSPSPTSRIEVQSPEPDSSAQPIAGASARDLSNPPAETGSSKPQKPLPRFEAHEAMDLKDFAGQPTPPSPQSHVSLSVSAPLGRPSRSVLNRQPPATEATRAPDSNGASTMQPVAPKPPASPLHVLHAQPVEPRVPEHAALPASRVTAPDAHSGNLRSRSTQPAEAGQRETKSQPYQPAKPASVGPATSSRDFNDLAKYAAALLEENRLTQPIMDNLLAFTGADRDVFFAEIESSRTVLFRKDKLKPADVIRNVVDSAMERGNLWLMAIHYEADTPSQTGGAAAQKAPVARRDRGRERE